jgi:hypothetical protein
MFRIFVLLIPLILVFVCAESVKQTTSPQALPVTTTTTKFMRVGDTYVVAVPGVTWKLQFPVNELVPMESDSSRGYYSLIHESMFNLLQAMERKEDIEALARKAKEAHNRIINVSFFIDQASKCGNDVRICRDLVVSDLKKRFAQIQKPSSWQAGGIYVFECDLPLKNPDGTLARHHHLYAQLVLDGVWIDFHLSRGPYEDPERQLLLHFLRSVRLAPVGGTVVTTQTAGVSRAVVPGVDDRIAMQAMSVRLPQTPGWHKREVSMPYGGLLLEFERALVGGNRIQIHGADYLGPLARANYDFANFDRSDAERLAWFLRLKESVPLIEVRRHSEWVESMRSPHRRFNAACRELHEIREERAETGELFLWTDWMLHCIDPVTKVPVQIDYAERYPAEGAPSPSFSEETAKFFDSVEFRPAAK